MSWTTLVGFGAGLCTTVAFLPQVIKTWKTRATRDISLATYLVFTLGVALWLCYGLLLRDPTLVLANFVTLVLAATVVVLKLRHG